MPKTRKKRGIIARQAARALPALGREVREALERMTRPFGPYYNWTSDQNYAPVHEQEQAVDRLYDRVRSLAHLARLSQGETRVRLDAVRLMVKARAFAPLRERLATILKSPCREGKERATGGYGRRRKESAPLLRTADEVATWIKSRLLDVQGTRRRERTIGPESVLQVIREAVTEGSGRGWTGGGTVAKSYGYRAVQTVAHAERLKTGAVWLAIDVISAYTPGTTCGARQVLILGTAARSLVARHLRATRVQRHAALRAALAGVEPDLIVTRADSLQAGNCAEWTGRAAAALGESAQARDIVLWACKHGVLTFAQRAIEQARRRTAQPTEAAR